MNRDWITRSIMKRTTWIILAVLTALVVGAWISVRSGVDEGATEFDEQAAATVEEVAGRALAEESAIEPEMVAESASNAEGSSRDVAFVVGSSSAPGLRVIRDGRVDVRIEPGTFDQASSEVRVIAEDLGGYVSDGETHLQTIDEEDHAVGWFTLRVPATRFDEAMARVEGLGERLNLEVSSQDVSEEYVDLEARLRSWERQEAFYAQLIEDATSIKDLVAIQTRLEDVLMNVEQIEGRIRYLDERTEYATITAGITEVPGAVPPGGPPTSPAIVTAAIEQAGAVLLGTVGFIIVGAAFLLPIALLAATAYVLFRAVQATRRRPTSS